jgi:nucleoside-diphosphate-sugar epimerase
MAIPTSQIVMVTGASGFIGRRLMRRLIERRCQVFCLVRADSRVDELRQTGAQMVTGDVTDRDSVERALTESKADIVFHLAGLVRATTRGDFTRVNTGGVENVAAACAACPDVPVLVVVSSLAAAGPGTADRVRMEGDLPTPVSNYGRSKLAGEQAAAGFASVVPITIVRPPIVFGPGDGSVLEMFRPVARWGVHVVPGWGRGDRQLSLIHVDDLVECILLAAEKGERLPAKGDSTALAGHGIYFAAADEQPTFAQLGDAIATALACKQPVVLPLPGPLLRFAGRIGDAMGSIRGRPGWLGNDKITEALAGSWRCSSAKARKLGWSPATTLANRLSETAQWYRQSGWL